MTPSMSEDLRPASSSAFALASMRRSRLETPGTWPKRLLPAPTMAQRLRRRRLVSGRPMVMQASPPSALRAPSPARGEGKQSRDRRNTSSWRSSGLAQAREDFVRVLTEIRGGGANLRWRFAQRDTPRYQADMADFRMRNFPHQLQMLHLRIGEHLVQGIDRGAGHVMGAQQGQPMLSFLLAKDIGQEPVQDAVIQIGRASCREKSVD